MPVQIFEIQVFESCLVELIYYRRSADLVDNFVRIQEISVYCSPLSCIGLPKKTKNASCCCDNFLAFNITGAPSYPDRILLHLYNCIPSGAIKWYLFGHPRGTWFFSKLQGIQYYFPENFRCNLTYYKSEDFSDSSLHHTSESKTFRFLFSSKNSLTWGVKWEKLNFRKWQGIY